MFHTTLSLSLCSARVSTTTSLYSNSFEKNLMLRFLLFRRQFSMWKNRKHGGMKWNHYNFSPLPQQSCVQMCGKVRSCLVGSFHPWWSPPLHPPINTLHGCWVLGGDQSPANGGSLLHLQHYHWSHMSHIVLTNMQISPTQSQADCPYWSLHTDIPNKQDAPGLMWSYGLVS